MRDVLASFAALFLIACSGATEDSVVPPRYERVVLRLAVARPRPTVEILEVHRVEHGLEGWTVVSEQQKILERGSALALELRGKQPRNVRVRTAIDQSTFNQVRIHGRFRMRCQLSLRLIANGKVIFQRQRSVNAGNKPQLVRFDLPRRRKASGSLEAIELAIEGSGPLELIAFELVRTPIELALPLPEDAPEIVSIQDDSRRSVGLTLGTPLIGELAVEHPSEALHFSIAVPASVRTSVRGGRLVATVGEGDRVRRKRLNLPGKGRWVSGRIGLEPFVGQDVPVRFELEGADEGVLACALANVELRRPGPDAPSVLLVTSDTHRGDHLGSARAGVEVDTPILDELAARGVLFEDAWSTTNVTAPSHVALMTGVHPRDTRLIGNSGHLDDSAQTLAEAFAAAGWMTVGVVSVHHLGPRGIGLGQGFDRMREPPGRPWDAEDAVNAALEYVAEAEGLPLFVWLHLFDAHDPYAPPEDFDRLYYPQDKDPFSTDLPEVGWERGTVPLHLFRVRDPEYVKAQYRAEVAYLDRQLAGVIAHSRLRDGWIAVTADHGEILEKAGTWFNHTELFPDTLHVPLILAGPHVPVGVRVSAPVEQVHVGRTLLDLAGLSGVNFPGRNVLLATVDGPNEPVTRFALSAGGFSAALSDGRWYLMLNLKVHKSMLPRQREYHEVELYDLATDPTCVAEVSAENPDVTRELRARLVAWLEDAVPKGFARHVDISAEDLAALAALGYAGDMPDVGERRWMDAECQCVYCEQWR